MIVIGLLIVGFYGLLYALVKIASDADDDMGLP